jgi:hypothetical protein
MISLICFLLLAATRVGVTDEVYQIAARPQWRFVPISLKQRPALVEARFEVISGPQNVRLALLRSEDIEKLLAEAPHSVLDVTAEGGAGELSYPIREPGDYGLVIDNGSRAPVSVRVQVWLDFGKRGPAVVRLSPERQLTVILISFAVFFGIVSWSARRLLRAVRH